MIYAFAVVRNQTKRGLTTAVDVPASLGVAPKRRMVRESAARGDMCGETRSRIALAL